MKEVFYSTKKNDRVGIITVTLCCLFIVTVIIASPPEGIELFGLNIPRIPCLIGLILLYLHTIKPFLTTGEFTYEGIKLIRFGKTFRTVRYDELTEVKFNHEKIRKVQGVTVVGRRVDFDFYIEKRKILSMFFIFGDKDIEVFLYNLAKHRPELNDYIQGL